MEHGLDIVAVEIEDERTVVVGMVVLAHTGCAEVASSGGDGGGVKSIDLGSVSRGEGDVRRGDHLELFWLLERRRADTDPEVGLAITTEAAGPGRNP